MGYSEESAGPGILPLSFSARNSISTRGRVRLVDDETNFQNALAMQQGNGQISAADARTIQNPAGYFTLVWTESEQQIESYTAPLAAVLGRNHPNVKEHYRTHWGYFQEAMNRRCGVTAPAVFVFLFHVHHRAWFEAQMTHTATTLLPHPQVAHNCSVLVETYRGFQKSVTYQS